MSEIIEEYGGVVIISIFGLCLLGGLITILKMVSVL